MKERIITPLIPFRKSIALTLTGFLLACFAQSAQSNEPTDGVGGQLPDVTQRYDFNLDGHPDFVLNRGPATGIWYLDSIIFLSGALAPTLPPFGWRLIDAADFNGDGHPDYALFNNSTRQTAIWYMSGRTRVGAVYGPSVGVSFYQLKGAADYSGEGYPDYILFNISTHQTLILFLHNNVSVGSAFGPTLPAEWTLTLP